MTTQFERDTSRDDERLERRRQYVKARLEFWEGIMEKVCVHAFLLGGVFVFWCWIFKLVVL